jgi:hypothetical protein
MCKRWLLAISLATLATSTVRSEPLNNRYRECSQQTLEEAIALESSGDREALRDYVRSFGCALIYPEALRPFAPERKKERRGSPE